MGASEAKQSPSFYNNYKFLQKKSSPAFGDLTIMQETTSKQLVAIREQVFQTLKDYELETGKLSKQAQYHHPNIIQLRQVNSFCEKQFCSSVYKIMHAIEYLPIDLMSDLQQRKGPYTEHDLLALLKDVSSAIQFLQTKNLTHGDLRMTTIFLQNSNSKRTVYKIAEPSVLRVMPAYLSVLTGHDTKGLLFSPKLMDGLRTKAWSPKHNVSKSDVFSLGCILLECAICKSSDEIFDFKECKVLKNVLEERKALVQQNFSEDFQNIIIKMLTLDEAKRPDFTELAALIEGNENNVLKPIVNRQVNAQNVVKEKETLTEKSKGMLDSHRSTSEDKENIMKSSQNQKKVLKPSITVIENPEQTAPSKQTILAEIQETEDFIEPMRPDEKSTAAVFPSFTANSVKPNGESLESNRPSPTEATAFLFSIERTISVDFVPKKEDIPLKNEETAPKQEKEDRRVSVYEYGEGVSFIRPEIQAILNEFRGIIHQAEVPLPVPKTPEAHQLAINSPQVFSKSPTDNLIIPAEISAISDLMADKFEEPAMTQEVPKLPSARILVYETYEDGSVYHGEKMSNMRDGKGKFYYSDGGMYDGDWKEGHIHGFGVLFYPNGCIAYQGEWRMDKFHGKGIVYNESPVNLGEFNYRNFEELGEGWVKYEGDFAEDNKEGEGMLSLVNGEVFVGNFIGDCVQGKGKFYLRDGSCVEGVWTDNVLQE